MLFFFRVFCPSEDIDIYGCVDEHGTFYWKASTLLKCIGYKKPSDVIRSHLSNIMSFDVLLSKHDPLQVTKPTYNHIPPQSKMITHDQFLLICSHLSKHNHSFMSWYDKIWNCRLNGNHVYFKPSVHVNSTSLPQFYVDELNGTFYLKDVPTMVFSNQVKPEIVCEPSNSSEQEHSHHRMAEPSMFVPFVQLNIGPIGPHGIPTQLFYHTGTRDVYVFQNEGRFTE